jgi:DNA-directed RNA polymerase subunit L
MLGLTHPATVGSETVELEAKSAHTFPKNFQEMLLISPSATITSSSPPLNGRISEDGRRGQEKLSVKATESRDGKYALEIRGSDLTWISHVVERIHTNFNASNAHWKQDHPLDDAIKLVAMPIEIRNACSSLVEDLRSIKLRNGGEIRLEGPQASYSFANLIRRALLTRVPVLAADSVTVERNDSSTQDEVLAHRIGQISLLFGPEASGSLNLEAGEFEMVVFAGDILFASPIVAVSPEDSKVPLGCLPPGGAIKLKISTRVDVGLCHAKYTAVASVPVVSDVQFEEIPVDTHKIGKLQAAGFACDNVGLVSRVDGGHVRVERIAEILECTVQNLKVIVPPPGISLYVESLGQRSQEECLTEATQAILKELEVALASLLPSIP